MTSMTELAERLYKTVSTIPELSGEEVNICPNSGAPTVLNVSVGDRKRACFDAIEVETAKDLNWMVRERLGVLPPKPCPITATWDNVVLKVLKKERKKGSILMPDTQSDESDFCEVVSVGPEVTISNNWDGGPATKLKAGDLVLRPTPAEYEWIDEDDDDQVYLVCPMRSVVAVKHGG
jgi:co-chaperonin GroES (HSP10)